MKIDTFLKCMYGLTAAFVCAAVAMAVISVMSPSHIQVTWSESLAASQEWVKDPQQLQVMLDSMFPDRERGSVDESTPNEILPNFQTLVNINTASAEELCTLPGIGETLAERIIAYRTENGIFESKEALLNVSGIGDKKFQTIADLITV